MADVSTACRAVSTDSQCFSVPGEFLLKRAALWAKLPMRTAAKRHHEMPLGCGVFSRRRNGLHGTLALSIGMGNFSRSLLSIYKAMTVTCSNIQPAPQPCLVK